MKTAELKFLELCEDIDRLKAQILYWKDKFEKLENEHSRDIKDNFDRSWKRTDQIVKLAMCADPEKLKKHFGGE